MADLKTNYVDDVLDTTKNQLRKYQQIQNDDGTVSFVDVTEYTQVGTSFGAKDINDTNAAINDVNGKLNINNIGIAFPTALGASIISKNVMCMINGIIYIDILFQLSNEVGNGGTVFSLTKGSSAITFNKRLDIVCYGNKMYSIVLIPNTNYFMANGLNIPAGNYKFTAIIDNN